MLSDKELDAIDHQHATPEGFSEFWEGYLLGLAFTAKQYTDEDDENGVSLYNESDCDIFADIVDLADFQIDLALAHLIDDLMEEAKDFFQQAALMIAKDYARAGSDFHLTRNGHGSGFWDGDWPGDDGAKLADMSKPYGTCELVKLGDRLDIMN